MEYITGVATGIGRAIVLLCKATVADDSQVHDMVRAVTCHFGGLDILVNNAGVTDFVKRGDLEGLNEEYWDPVMAVNVKGMFLVGAKF